MVVSYKPCEKRITYSWSLLKSSTYKFLLYEKHKDIHCQKGILQNLKRKKKKKKKRDKSNLRMWSNQNPQTCMMTNCLQISKKVFVNLKAELCT